MQYNSGDSIPRNHQNRHLVAFVSVAIEDDRWVKDLCHTKKSARWELLTKEKKHE
jgi:hypothetical protein